MQNMLRQYENKTQPINFIDSFTSPNKAATAANFTSPATAGRTPYAGPNHDIFDPEPPEVAQARQVLKNYYLSRRAEIWGRRPTPPFFDHNIDAALWPENIYWIERGVMGRLTMTPGCKVMDFCCGDGYYSDIWYSTIAGQIDAIDNDPGVLKFAQTNHANPKIKYHSVDVLTQPFPADDYDVVTWFGAIEHFSEQNIIMLLQKIKSVLKPGGILIGSTPAFNDPDGAKARNHQHDREFKDQNDLVGVLTKVFPQTQTWASIHPVRTILFFQSIK